MLVDTCTGTICQANRSAGGSVVEALWNPAELRFDCVALSAELNSQHNGIVTERYTSEEADANSVKIVTRFIKNILSTCPVARRYASVEEPPFIFRGHSEKSFHNIRLIHLKNGHIAATGLQ